MEGRNGELSNKGSWLCLLRGSEVTLKERVSDQVWGLDVQLLPALENQSAQKNQQRNNLGEYESPLRTTCEHKSSMSLIVWFQADSLAGVVAQVRRKRAGWIVVI